MRNPFCKLPKHITQSAEDYVHKKLHHSEIRAELVRFARPEVIHVDQEDERGQTTVNTTFESPMTTDDLFVAFQQRCVQTQWMIHKHSLGYCLKCGKCRFFFPYGICTEQKHDETINRMVHVRRREEDDSMVATHSLDSLLVADTHVHVQVFCPTKGSRLAGLYTVVYIAKKDPEARFNTVHSDDTEVSKLLKVRTTGLPMMWYFANGGQLFDLNREVMFFPCLFEEQGYFLHNFAKIFAAGKRKDKNLKLRCVTITEKYLWRPGSTRHLRAEQFMRYFRITNKQTAQKERDPNDTPNRGFTTEWREAHDVQDDVLHPNYDAKCALMRPGKIILYDHKDCGNFCLMKRSTKTYGCLRTFNFPPTNEMHKDQGTTNRDLYFQQKLFMSLPWYCASNGRIKCTPAICPIQQDGSVDERGPIAKRHTRST